jgi:hypothetical protein
MWILVGVELTQNGESAFQCLLDFHLTDSQVGFTQDLDRQSRRQCEDPRPDFGHDHFDVLRPSRFEMNCSRFSAS